MNLVLLKGTQELIESHNKWKQRSHILRYFDANEWDPQVRLAAQKLETPLEKQGSTFLKRFLSKQ